MQQRLLVKLQYDGTNYEYYSTDDISFDNKGWERRVLTWDNISEEQTDSFYGRRIISPMTMVLDNTDKHFTNMHYLNDLRQRQLIIYITDKDNPAFENAVYYYITSAELTRTECRITAIREHVDKFDETYPRVPYGIINTTIFPDAITESLGKAVPICLGYHVLVPCVCIQEDDLNNQYDYLIGFGYIDNLIEVYRNGISVLASEYTFYDGSQGSPYPGYSFLRFTTEQRDSDNRLLDISAVVDGIKISGSYSSNPVINLQEFLSNTIWGMGLTYDAASFSAAATAAGIEVDNSRICINTFKKASEHVNDMLLSCYCASLYKRGSYEITVPTYKTGSEKTFTKYNMKDIKLYRLPVDELTKTVTVYGYYNPVDENYAAFSTYDTGKSFGIAREYHSPYSYTGDEIACAQYLGKRFRFHDLIVEFTTGQDGYALGVEDIITINNPDFKLSNVRFEILSINKGYHSVQIKCSQYSNLIFL